VEVTRAQSVRLQALFSYASAQAEFDRVTSSDTEYHVTFDDPLRGRETRTEKMTAKEEARRAKIDDLRPPKTTTTRTTTTTTRSSGLSK
jgi:ketosteroid isomerase-like protein